jgi:DNA polymerase III gamma/tau subunit
MARDVLGIVPAETVAEVVRAIAGRDAASALAVLDRELRAGRDAVEILDHAIEHVRAAVRGHVGGQESHSGDLVSDPAESAAIEGTRALLALDEALLIVQVLLETRRRLARAEGRIVLELAVIRLCRRSAILSIDEALKELRAGGGGDGKSGGESGHSPASPPSGASSAPSRPREGERAAPAPLARPEAAPARVETMPPTPPPKQRGGDGENPVSASGAARGKTPDTVVSAPGPAPYVPAFERFVEEVRARARLLASCLSAAKLIERKEGRIVVGMPKLSPFQKAQFDSPASQKILADAAAAAFSGGTHVVKVDFVLSADAPPAAEPAAARGPLADPILDKVIELFDGKVVDVDRSGRRRD